MDLFRWRRRCISYNGCFCKGWFWGSGARRQRCVTHGGVVRHQFMLLRELADALISRSGRKRTAYIWMGKSSRRAYPLVTVSFSNFLETSKINFT